MISNRILKQVLVLNEEKNFARAAEELHLSQPTLSRNIQALEKRLGNQLFDRVPRNLRLTTFGELVVRHAEKIVVATSLLENEIAQFSNLQAGHLKLGVGPYPAETSFSKAIGLFNEQFPKIHIQSITDNWENLHTLLVNEKIEFFVSDKSELENSENLEITPFKPHPAFFYCRHDHPILEKDGINLTDCMQYSLIFPKLPKWVIQFMDTHGDSQVNQEQQAYIECDNVGMSKIIVLNSFAIGIGIYSVVSTLLQDKSIKIIPFYPESFKTDHGMVKLKNHTLSPAAQKFIGILNQVEDELCIEEAHYFSNTPGFSLSNE
jgi:DNA-binding transcriptional LysR family regulator